MTSIAPHAHPQRRHTDLRLVAGAALVVALVALGAWALARDGEPRSRDQVLVEDVMAAWNARDGDAIERLYARDAVLAFGPDDPGILGREKIAAQADEWWNTAVLIGDPITVFEPPTGFQTLTEGVEPHYVVAPVLIHDDAFVSVFEVRGGKVSTHMVFEPFVPISRALEKAKQINE